MCLKSLNCEWKGAAHADHDRVAVDAARYLADEIYRRGIARQLNKGENLLTCAVAATTSSRASRCGA